MTGSREPRLLIYSQDGYGLGHLRRTTLLADEFLRSCPGASALTISDSPLGKFFSSAAGHDYCKLPSVRKVGPGDWRPVSLASSFADVLDVRRAMLRTTVLAFRPDVLLVDHMPHGAMGELLPTLELLREEPTVVVLGLRDILDAPPVVRERWRVEGAYEAVERFYDRVLVYGSPDVFDVSSEYDWPEATRSMIRYCGYVCGSPPRQASQSVWSRFVGALGTTRLVVAMAGGGADAYPLFDTLLTAVPAIHRANACHFLVITGPFLPEDQRADLVARAESLPVDVLTSVPDPMSYAASADLVVAMAGYNTTAEILSVGTPALLVPRSGPSAEQQMRARLFAERGWVDWLRPDALSPETLTDAVTTILTRSHAPTPTSPPDLGGRTEGTHRLVESLNGYGRRRPSGTTTPAPVGGRAARRSPADLDGVLAARTDWSAVARFLDAVAPGEVRRAVRQCLPPGVTDPLLRLVRAKLKPGRKLTVEYEVVLSSANDVRRVSATWVAAGSTPPGPADAEEDEARRRGVLAPFRRSWIASDDDRMSLSVAPVDGAFPQMARLNERRHVLRALRSALPGAELDGVPPERIVIGTVRYRPGQRHVLRVGAGAGGPAWFAKIYRDEDAGRRAVDGAARVSSALGAVGPRTVAVMAVRGGYESSDRVAFWPEVTGSSLGEVIARSLPTVTDLVCAAGSALSAVHDSSAVEELAAGPDAFAQARETLRTAQLLDALVPDVGARMHAEVERAVDLLTARPAGPAAVTHGDMKCDNVVVSGSCLHLIDFDRVRAGDPAADVGKFLADLRWWTDGDGPLASRLHEAFLEGYGAAGQARLPRARVYDALLQLRMAARRVPLQDPSWERRVTRAVAVAARTLDEES